MNNQLLKSLMLLLAFPVLSFGDKRIVGGEDAPVSFGLFHASLQNLKGQHVCGGAIVSKFHIVTAAHCLHGAEPEHIKVVAATTDLKLGGLKYDASSIHIFEGFNFTSRENDIALLRVNKPFDLNYIKVIGLHHDDLLAGDTVFLSGFGAIKSHQESTYTMQVLMQPVFDQKTCKYAMRYTREVTDTMFCTFTKIGEGTCNGDSGSPLIKDDKLIGVVSWGIPCAVGFPDVHTRIRPFIQWIRNKIKNDICSIKNI